MKRWQETPANVVALLKDRNTPAFRAYRDAIRGEVLLRMMVTDPELGDPRLLRRKFDRATDLVIAASHSKSGPESSLRAPEDTMKFPLKQGWLALVEAKQRAEVRLPKYLSEVRRELRAYLNAWMNSGKDTARLYVEHPEVGSHIDAFLKLRHPVLARQNPAKIVYPLSVELGGRGPALEAARLFLVILISKYSKRVARCGNEECENFRLGGKRFCSGACRQKHHAKSKSKTFNRKRSAYMKRRRQEDIDEVIKWASESNAQGERLIKLLNIRLASQKVKHRTIDLIAANWLARHWPEIERSRRRHGKH